VNGLTDEIQSLDPQKIRAELIQRLGDLRGRIIRLLIYLVIGSCIAYTFFEPIYRVLFRPMQAALAGRTEWKIVFTHFPQAFFVVLQLSVVAGFVLMLPLVTLEMWGFLSPVLSWREKRLLRIVAPFSILLFAGGVALAYFVAQSAIGWFTGYVEWFPQGVLYQEPKAYVVFMLKVMAVLGLMFQLPLVLMFLAWIGLIHSAGMKKYWRHAIVGIAFVGMLVTPTNDAMTMLMMVVPVFCLYLGSIGLVRWVEKRRTKSTYARESRGGE